MEITKKKVVKKSTTTTKTKNSLTKSSKEIYDCLKPMKGMSLNSSKIHNYLYDNTMYSHRTIYRAVNELYNNGYLTTVTTYKVK
jgi:Fe2+ or Zn2+ uptake regulation protein